MVPRAQYEVARRSVDSKLTFEYFDIAAASRYHHVVRRFGSSKRKKIISRDIVGFESTDAA
jgi:hypothetical protein